MNILIVDDEPWMRDVLMAAIKKACPEVVSIVPAENGKHALEIFNVSEQKFDLIISDKNMPKMELPKLNMPNFKL